LKKNSGWLLLKVWNDKSEKTASYSEYDSVNQNYYRVEGRNYTDLALGFGLGKNGHKKEDLSLK
jgi:hypothetical protein